MFFIFHFSAVFESHVSRRLTWPLQMMCRPLMAYIQTLYVSIARAAAVYMQSLRCFTNSVNCPKSSEDIINVLPSRTLFTRPYAAIASPFQPMHDDNTDIRFHEYGLELLPRHDITRLDESVVLLVCERDFAKSCA